jgi:hypothetical protein
MTTLNKWSSQDELLLLTLISKDKSMNKIVKKLNKNKSYIIKKLKRIAFKLHNEKQTTDEINKTLKFLSNEQINKIIGRVQNKQLDNIQDKQFDNMSEIVIKHKSPKENNIQINETNNVDNNTIFVLLNTINDKLDLIINKTNLFTKDYVRNRPSEKIKKDSSSIDTSGDDTDEIKNMIQNRLGVHK